MKNFSDIFENNGPSTGLSALDERWGGLTAGKLIVLAGRAGIGKSMVAGHIAFEAAKTHRVLFLSLEMTAEQIMMRQLSSSADIETLHLMRAEDRQDDFWEKISAGRKILESRNIAIHDKEIADIKSITACAIGQSKNESVDLIVIENLDSLSTSSGDGSKSIAAKLKNLAGRLRCSVLVTSHISSDVDERLVKRPTMSDLYNSGSEEIADILAIVYRDDYYDKSLGNHGTIEILTRKNRCGPTGDDRVLIDFTKARLSDLPDDFVEPESKSSRISRISSKF